MTETMQGHELRKLITTFLVLALLAGSASLAITSLVRQKSEGPAAKIAEQTGTQIPKVGDAALVEDIATTNIEGYDLAAEFSPSTDNDDNYTDNLTKGLAYNFVKANPEGPDLAGGTGILVPPNIDTVVQEYVTETALSPTTYAIDMSRVKIAKNYTPDQLKQYVTLVNNTVAKVNGDQGIGGVSDRSAGKELDDASAQAANFVYADAQEKLYDAVVPAPAAKLHTALLTYLELDRKLTDLDYTTDPLKAVVFLKKLPTLQEQEANNLNLAFADFEKQAPALLSAHESRPRVAAFLGINVAHAIPVEETGALLGIAKAQLKELVADAKANISAAATKKASFGQQLKEWAFKVATQVLKNQLVGRLIQQTIKWVQGGGKPQFITNWKAFLKDSATGAVNDVINQVSPRLCENLRAFTTDFMRTSTQNSVSGSRDQYQKFNCTLDQVVQSVKGFYDDFLNGGAWTGLATLVLEPQNNIWGSIVLSHETAITQAAESQDAAKADAQANEGFKGLNRCVNLSYEVIPQSELAARQKSPDYYGLSPRGCYSTTGGGGANAGEYEYCQRNPNEYTAPSGALCDDIIAAGPPQLASVCEIQYCASGNEQKITPGGFVANQLSDAVNLTGQNIVNASDLTGLVAALVDSAISKLTGLATNGLLGLFSGGNSDPGNGGGNGGGSGSGAGGDDGLAALKAQSAQIIGVQQQSISLALSENEGWPTTASSTQPLLVSVVPTCPALAEDAEQRLGAIDRIADTVNRDQESLNGVASDLAAASAAINAATDALTIADLMANLESITSGVATISTRVTARVTQITSLKGDAEANLAERACSTPLTRLDE